MYTTVSQFGAACSRRRSQSVSSLSSGCLASPCTSTPPTRCATPPAEFEDESALQVATGGKVSVPPPVPPPVSCGWVTCTPSSTASSSSSMGCTASSSGSLQFTHDPYNWNESSRMFNVQEARVEAQLQDCTGAEAAAAKKEVSKEDQEAEPVLGSIPVPVGTGPTGNPLFRHTVYRSTPTQRIGAWIRGNAVTNVVPEGPAVAAGLEAGMRVLEVEGEPANPATVSAIVRKVWKEVGVLTLVVEVQPAGTKSKRSLAKARARARARLASQQKNAEENKISAEEMIDEAAFTCCY